MTRIKSHLNPLQDIKTLYLFLKEYQLLARENKQSSIISLSLKIPPVDPLSVLKIIAQPQQSHFYLEKKVSKEFVLAIDTVIKKEISGNNRFIDTKAFIEYNRRKIIVHGDILLPFATPHFFCSFSFFANDCYTQDTFADATVFLPAIQVTRRQQDFILTTNLMISPDTDLHKLVDRTNKQIQKIITVKEFIYNHQTSTNNNHSSQINIKEIEHFQSVVNLALESINTQNISKIVVAHSIDVNLSNKFQFTHTLDCLRHTYPCCYTFSVSNGKGINFIGASPERLLKIHNGQLLTDTLAGSAPRGKTEIEDNHLAKSLLNNDKEIAEHQLVREFIREQLIKLKLTPIFADSPQLLRLANIQHLWTPIGAKLTNQIHALDLVSTLHPTPAVGGIPQNLACQQIQRHENFQRNLYAAPLGWIDYQGNSEFVVGIRSALLTSNSARLYAGAGIVAKSNSKMETEEIRLKFQPLLSTL